MKINPEMFRAYDLRGLVDKDLNPEIVEAIGKAYGTYLKRLGIMKAVVGRDCRATSEDYADALLRGFSWAGIDCVDIGLNLVGTFYWSQYYLDIKAGAFVTASHNPPEYNGFKFANDFSETLVSDGMATLCKWFRKTISNKAKFQATLKNAIFARLILMISLSVCHYPSHLKF